MSTRLLEQGWEPQLWSIAATGRTTHPLILRRQLDQAGACGLVEIDDQDRVVAAILGAELEGVRASVGGPVWVVDEFYVSDVSQWSTTGRALLAALAARARSALIGRVMIGCSSIDQAKSAMLAQAGLDRCGWIRRRQVPSLGLAPPVGARALVEADAAEVAVIVAAAPRHRHSLPAVRRFNRDGRLVTGGLVVDHGDGIGAVALVGPPISAPPGYQQNDHALLADPLAIAVGASWDGEGTALLGGVEWLAASRGDHQVIVPCGPGEPEREAALRERGYLTAAEWWCLDLRRD